MNDLTAIPPQQPSHEFRRHYAADLSAEIAKMLALVAPSTMTAEQQTLWLAAAVDALQDIRADEVQKISAEVRRSVQRHNQIVPKIADLVAENRKRAAELLRAKAENEAWRSLPRPKKHIADRDRRYFSADDWAELNVWLESQGATARYRTDGSRYTISAGD